MEQWYTVELLWRSVSCSYLLVLDWVYLLVVTLVTTKCDDVSQDGPYTGVRTKEVGFNGKDAVRKQLKIDLSVVIFGSKISKKQRKLR